MHKAPRSFDTEGYAVLPQVLSRREARRIDTAGPARFGPAARRWSKAAWIANPLYAGLVLSPDLLVPIKAILGPDILLWGVRYLTRKPGQIHAWHSDLESADPEGGFASVWIGLRNIGPATGLSLIAGSHRIGHTIQDEARRHEVKTAEIGAETVAAWARDLDPGCRLETPDVAVGDAVLFDGRLWHGTHNTSDAERSALLVQYARADRPVRMYDFTDPANPVRKKMRPPVALVGGTAGPHRALNHFRPTPEPGERFVPLLEPAPILPRPPGKTFQPHQLFRMNTDNVDIHSHYSTLAPGARPHPPHAHAEEELLIVLDGTADVLMGQGKDDPEPDRMRIEPGQFTYYRRHHFHTIENTSDRDVTYLMLRWSDLRTRLSPIRWRRRLDKSPRLNSRAFDTRPAMSDPLERPFQVRRIFEMPTDWTRLLHCHLSRLKPGGGYKAHRDRHDVALVVLKGAIRVGDETLKGPGLAWLPAGCLHGMKNVGQDEATYLTFEFHNLTGGRKG